MFECEKLTACEVLNMYLQCSDEKVLHIYHYFMRFMEFFCRYNSDTLAETQSKMNERRSKILGYETKYAGFYMYDAHRNGSVDILELMLQESKSKSYLMDEDYKEKFMESEICDLQSYILKCYAKKGEDKTEEEVSKMFSPLHVLTANIIRNILMLIINGRTLVDFSCTTFTYLAVADLKLERHRIVARFETALIF